MHISQPKKKQKISLVNKSVNKYKSVHYLLNQNSVFKSDGNHSENADKTDVKKTEEKTKTTNTTTKTKIEDGTVEAFDLHVDKTISTGDLLEVVDEVGRGCKWVR